MSYKRFTTIAGKTIITRMTDSSFVKCEKGRRPKMNPTSAAVAADIILFHQPGQQDRPVEIAQKIGKEGG